jgi:hypothetical protein
MVESWSRGAYLGEKVVNENEYRSAMISVYLKIYTGGNAKTGRGSGRLVRFGGLKWARS